MTGIAYQNLPYFPVQWNMFLRDYSIDRGHVFLRPPFPTSLLDLIKQHLQWETTCHGRPQSHGNRSCLSKQWETTCHGRPHFHGNGDSLSTLYMYVFAVCFPLIHPITMLDEHNVGACVWDRILCGSRFVVRLQTQMGVKECLMFAHLLCVYNCCILVIL